jgi:hypothetical protein
VIMSDVARIKTERNTRSTWGILGTLVRRPCVTKRATLFDRSERHKRSRACTHFSAAPAKSDCSYWQYASSDSTARLCNSAMQRTTNACLCEVASTSEVMAAARGQMVCGAAVQSCACFCVVATGSEANNGIASLRGAIEVEKPTLRNDCEYSCRINVASVSFDSLISCGKVAGGGKASRGGDRERGRLG